MTNRIISKYEEITQRSIAMLIFNKEQTTLLKREFSNRSFKRQNIKPNMESGKMEKKTQPTHKITIGQITMALWLNETENKNIMPTVTIQKRYYDKDEKTYKDATSFNASDLPVFALMSNMMSEYIVEKVDLHQKKL